MNNLLISYIRTGVPVVIGAFLAWLAKTTGVVIDSGSSMGAVIFVTAFLINAYYAVVRALEKRFPQFGWLLGVAAKPKYAPIVDGVHQVTDAKKPGAGP